MDIIPLEMHDENSSTSSFLLFDLFFFLIPSIGYFFRFLIAWRAVFTFLFLGKKKKN